MPFADRVDAGRRLARGLRHLRGENVVVLALPRGGVPVAFQVAEALGAPLDVLLVRKVGLVGHPDLPHEEHVVGRVRMSGGELAELARRARDEVERRASRFRGGRPAQSPAGRTAVLVDDGIATGATARAACRVARAQGAARVVLAVPVCSARTAAVLRGEVDELVCLEIPRRFLGVGQFYADFRQTSDEEVVDLLDGAAARVGAPATRDEESGNSVHEPLPDRGERLCDGGREPLPRPGHTCEPAG